MGRIGEASRRIYKQAFVAIGNEREMWGDAVEPLTRSILYTHNALLMSS